MNNFRNSIIQSSKIAIGCSHTYGVGVEETEAWPYLLDAMNFGRGGCSCDLIARTLPDLIELHKPTVIYMLYPDWSRFEYVDNDIPLCSYPTDKNRIYLMEKHNEEWLHQNFDEKVIAINETCRYNNVTLVDMTLYDLIPYMDYADKWPISKLGHHYAPSWHNQVADIFSNALTNNIQHELRKT
jgi:hypothetical protein